MIDKLASKWDTMEYDELKEAVVRAIMGQGMGGSTQYLHFCNDYFNRIDKQDVQDNVIKIVSDLAEDFETPSSSRALYLLGELPMPDKHQKIVEIVERLNPLVDEIVGSKQVPERCIKYLDYICELNRIIGKLNIVEAMPLLEKQAQYIKRPMPMPLTNEYYVYHLAARSAVDNLKRLKV